MHTAEALDVGVHAGVCKGLDITLKTTAEILQERAWSDDETNSGRAYMQ